MRGYARAVTEASTEAFDVAGLVARSRRPELAHVRTMLGADQRGDGLRLMRIDAAPGVGSTAFVEFVRGQWEEGPVLALDARSGDGLADAGGDDPAVALELRARSAASRVQSLTERGRVLVTIDHAWENDLAASLYGAFVDALDEHPDVSVLVVRRDDVRAPEAAAWHAILDEISHRRPMPARRRGARPAR